MEVKKMSASDALKAIREQIMEWSSALYRYQILNKDEASERWYPPIISEKDAYSTLELFYTLCLEYKSFKFFIDPVIADAAKLCSYSDLLKITDFKVESIIQTTISGRLFRGIIGEGSEKRHVIVKTWDFLLPSGYDYAERPSRFCDEIELFTDEKANKHENLLKLCTFCCEKRLAAVYDGNFTKILSAELQNDQFGWDKRISVATQLADLLAWLHEKGIAVGTVSPECILIHEEVNIKVFDFGYISNNVRVDSKIPVKSPVGKREAPEVREAGYRTMKSDVYIFGLLLLELITKKEFNFFQHPVIVNRLILVEATCGSNGMVAKCFNKVDHQTASEITDLTISCTKLVEDGRPTMKYVSGVLKKIQQRGEKRKRGADVQSA